MIILIVCTMHVNLEKQEPKIKQEPGSHSSPAPPTHSQAPPPPDTLPKETKTKKNKNGERQVQTVDSLRPLPCPHASHEAPPTS